MKVKIFQVRFCSSVADVTDEKIETFENKINRFLETNWGAEIEWEQSVAGKRENDALICLTAIISC